MTMQLTFINLLLFNNSNRIVLTGRIEKIKAYILQNFKLDTLTFHSSTGLLFIQWETYLKLQKENVSAYDKLTKNITNVLGYDVYRHILDLTTFLGRDVYVHKKFGGKDHIVQNVNEWV